MLGDTNLALPSDTPMPVSKMRDFGRLTWSKESTPIASAREDGGGRQSALDAIAGGIRRPA